jgi:CubicO group peptidase (beta-lactamase class C family)
MSMKNHPIIHRIIPLALAVVLHAVSAGAANEPAKVDHTRVSIVEGRWQINDQLVHAGTPAEGLLMNVRVVNCVFEDIERPEFDADANADEFIARIPEYVGSGIRAFTICLQGGYPGYEGAVNSAFRPDGTLRASYLQRVRRVIEACDRHGAVVILGCFYQRQDQRFDDEDAIRAALVGAVRWIRERCFSNVVLEVTNEFGHSGFDYSILKTASGQVELIRLAKKTAPKLLVSTSGGGGGGATDSVARASDFLLIHYNNTPLEDIPRKIAALKKYGKPIVCNEDQKVEADGAKALELSVHGGASWGFMHEKHNQHFPFHFKGVADDAVVYAKLRQLTAPKVDNGYFPPPESKGGWRKVKAPEEVRLVGGMDPERISALREWLLVSDKQQRPFAATVIRRGHIVLEIEKGLNAKTDLGRSGIASCAKAICATVLAVASEESQDGHYPKKMKFDDPAFQFIPWAHPLSDPRKARIKVKQLLNHTSGIVGEWWQIKDRGVKNNGPWEWVLGHSGDWRTEKLMFKPGTDLEYSTHGLYHAALVCEGVTGMPYDQFTIEHLFKPIGIETWWFELFEGDSKHGRHPSHALGLPAREMARIGYCMLREGRWGNRQVIPEWFVAETGAPTHDIKGTKTFGREAQSFSHGWELPARLTGGLGDGIPKDARFKPGTGGQLIAFVPSLDLVVVRMTGSSGGEYPFEDYLRRACAAVLTNKPDHKR